MASHSSTRVCRRWTNVVGRSTAACTAHPSSSHKCSIELWTYGIAAGWRISSPYVTALRWPYNNITFSMLSPYFQSAGVPTTQNNRINTESWINSYSTGGKFGKFSLGPFSLLSCAGHPTNGTLLKKGNVEAFQRYQSDNRDMINQARLYALHKDLEFKRHNMPVKTSLNLQSNYSTLITARWYLIQRGCQESSTRWTADELLVHCPANAELCGYRITKTASSCFGGFW